MECLYQDKKEKLFVRLHHDNVTGKRRVRASVQGLHEVHWTSPSRQEDKEKFDEQG